MSSCNRTSALHLVNDSPPALTPIASQVGGWVCERGMHAKHVKSEIDLTCTDQEDHKVQESGSFAGRVATLSQPTQARVFRTEEGAMLLTEAFLFVACQNERAGGR